MTEENNQPIEPYMQFRGEFYEIFPIKTINAEYYPKLVFHNLLKNGAEKRRLTLWNVLEEAWLELLREGQNET